MRNIAQAITLAALALIIPACNTEPPKQKGDPPLTLAFPEGGTYTTPQSVEITTYEQTAPFGPHAEPTIYLSLDGNDPSIGGANTMSGPGPWNIPIPEGTTTLKYFAVDSQDNIEPIRTQVYVVQVP